MWGGAEGGEGTNFRFNFGGGEAGDGDDGATTTAAETSGAADADAGSVIPGSEYVPSPDAAAPDWDMEAVIILGRRFVKGACSGTAALLVRGASSTGDVEGNGNFASSDVVKGKYEGGFKLWECSVDLAAYLLEHDVLRGDDAAAEAEGNAASLAAKASAKGTAAESAGGIRRGYTTGKQSEAAASGASCGEDRDGAAGEGRKRRIRRRRGGGKGGEGEDEIGGGGGGEDFDDDFDDFDADDAAGASSTSSAPLTGASVIELGCGHGLPGIAAAFRGAAAVTFADYNPEVLQTLTAPNVLANTPAIVAAAAAVTTTAASTTTTLTKTKTKTQTKGGEAVDGGEAAARAPSFRYLGGDWGCLHDFIKPQSADVVLAAETIYSPAAYPKHVAILHHCMKPPHGVALVAAKSYYFGVGGGTRLFAAAVEKDGTFVVDTVARCVDGASNVREILRVRFK